ncbi:hypothetical protein ACFQV2_27280 [Actinokineospora soli]|uniref:Uncharacterized protein n=1 Tax=Actinokineospora soli TaxID=1048753 RepID=A0ABW2TUZ3_9PSEU
MAESRSFEVRPLLLSPDEAAAGVERPVRLPDGREITVRVPPGVEDGTLLRLPDMAEDGDLFLRVQVVAMRVKRRFPFLPVAAVGAVVATLIIIDTSADDDPTAATDTTTTTTTTDYYAPTTTYDYTTTYAPTTAAEVTTVEAAPQDGTEVGECLRNKGTAASPNMLPSPCNRGAFEVVSRKLGTIDTGYCDGISATTHSYSVEKYTVYTRGGIEYDRVTNYAESYVFCLKQL